MSYAAARLSTNIGISRPASGREHKTEEILDVAVRQLRAGGYEALSVAGIARELGIAGNSVYWYFPSKDELFVAAVDRLLLGIVAEKPPGRRSLERRVLWFVEQLGDLDPLRAGMRERARYSAPVAELVERLDRDSRRMLRNVLSHEVEAEHLDLATEALLATIEGTWMLGLRGERRRRLLGFALSRFTA